MRTRLPALAILLAALLAGCQAEEDLTFSEQADAICEDQYADFANSLALTGTVSGPEQAAAARAELAEATEEATQKLTELAPPAESAEQFEAYLAARRNHRAKQARSIAAELGLLICAQEMEGDYIDVVEEALEETFTDPDLTCTRHYTARFLQEVFGSEELCPLAPAAELPTEVELRRIRGSEGEFAVADVVLRGGRYDGRRVTAVLLYQRSDPVITDLMGIDFSRPPPPAGS